LTTAEQAYERYLIKAEKNGTNNNIATDRGRFVIQYNELKNRVVKWYLNNRGKTEIKDIQVLLVDDKKVVPESSHLDHVDFKLPEDFLSDSHVRAVGEKGKCKNEDIRLFEIRDGNRSDILDNVNSSPSFEYRECPYTFSQNFLKVYIEEGMKLDKIYLSYYKYPNQISLINENNPEAGFDPTKNIELPDEVLDRIISSMVGDFKINTENQAFQFDKLREKENLTQG
jgi:hypothetical protein